jgi:hypothetical protein
LVSSISNVATNAWDQCRVDYFDETEKILDITIGDFDR